MIHSSIFTRAAFAVGVVSAVVLVWLWRQRPPSSLPPASVTALPPAGSNAATESAPSALSEAVLDPRASALLAALQRSLAASVARAREAVLTFKDDEALRRFLERAGPRGLTVLAQLDALHSVRVRFSDLRALGSELADNAADYASLGANNLVNIPSAPTRQERAAVNQVPFGNDALAFLGANGDRSNWGRGTTIAILDTGVAADATFGLGRVSTLDIGYGTTPGRGSEDGHGTAVAALAAGAAGDAPGVAPAANLLSIRVTDATGTSDLFTISQAIVAAVDAGARIINISLGGYTTGSVLDAAIDYATQRGALLVAAAGNDQAAQLAWPAADPRVVSVGAVDKAEQQVFFSNSGAQLQLAAPGYGVQTAWLDGQRVTVDGTSASAPLVAGAVAALMSANPNLTPQQAAALLARTANDAGQPGADPAFGRGIVNLGTALNSGNATYVDTAIASHFYNAEQNQLQIVVQNRSGRMVSGMSLTANVGGVDVRWTVPPLIAGESFVANAPADAVALKTNGSLRYTTQLVNPPGVTDQVPANNRRSSVLTAPTP